MNVRLLASFSAVILTISYVHTFGQTDEVNTKVDSLKQQIELTNNDSVKIELWLQLGDEFEYTDTTLALAFYNKALRLAKESENSKLTCKSYSYIGYVNNGQRALLYYDSLYHLAEPAKDTYYLSLYWLNAGDAHQYQGNYEKAVEFYSKSIELDLAQGDTLNSAGAIHNIGQIYGDLDEPQKALQFYHRAMKINLNKKGNKVWLATNYYMLGGVFKYNLIDYDSAEFYTLKMIELHESFRNAKYYLRDDYSSLGDVYRLQKRFFRSKQNFKKSRKFYLQTGKTRLPAFVPLRHGTLYYSWGVAIKKREPEFHKAWRFKLDTALLFIDSSIISYKKNGEIHRDIYGTKSKILQHLGRYKEALKAHETHKAINDSLNELNNKTSVANLLAVRENAEKDKRLAVLRTEKELEEKERKLIIIASAVALFLLSIIVFLVIRQRRKSDKLLLNILPATIAKRLKAKEHPIADHYDMAAVLFIDIVGFTKMSAETEPKRLVDMLNQLFTAIDEIADKHGLEKIKTIGDSYMAVAGVPIAQQNASIHAAKMAIDVKALMQDYKTSDGTQIQIRIGMDCGEVVAGVIGQKKFAYDLWSDTVNTAARMESSSVAGEIHVSENFKKEVESHVSDFVFIEREAINIKGKGLMKTYFISSKRRS